MKYELIEWRPASDPPKTGGNFLLKMTVGKITYIGTYDTTDPCSFSAVKGVVHEWAEFPTGPTQEADELVRDAMMFRKLMERAQRRSEIYDQMSGWHDIRFPDAEQVRFAIANAMRLKP